MGCHVPALFFLLVPFLLAPERSLALVSRQKGVLDDLSKAVNSTSWNTSSPDPCQWKGVTCDVPPSQVIGLSLLGFGLSNTSILRLMCSLESLQSLQLPGNSFPTLPPDFITDCGKLAGLKLLNFSGNKLSGKLPTFSGFTALEVLDLSYNFLEGRIDTSLAGLVQLRNLNLSFNCFNGSIPTEIGRAVGLQELSLSHNQFQGGVVPGVSSHHRNLTFLDLSFNNLSGFVPDSAIANLSKLEVLILSSNNLTGEVPRSLSTIESLHWFAANTNNFIGAIPPDITNHLRVLDLSFNRLNGPIPPDLLSPPNLESIDLSSNSLEGPIPRHISRSLFRLRLGGNRLLNGSIPLAIAELGNLAYLELDGNTLEGEIPPQLGNLAKLTLLNLANNQLKGVLPKELGKLTKLVVMKLQMNRIQGNIPYEFSGLRELLTLNLSRNSLSGTIPSSISSLTKLSILNLEYNQLNGQIPGSIRTLDFLVELQLGNNNISGSIPPMPPRLSTALNLSSNSFSGPIPKTLGGLPQLEILDLSHNGFEGVVPSFLTEMISLTHLVLSYNRLSGVLPQFRRGVVVDTAGNNDLVNSTTTGVLRSKKSTPTVVIIVVSLVTALVGSGIAAAVLISVVSRRISRVKDETPWKEEGLPQVVEGCFLTDDTVHRSQIDFAKAMKEVSKPSNVLSKSRFSTYYKAAMPSGTSYCVKKLNWSDKIFQMGNQWRFRQDLVALRMLGNSNVLTPLAYVLTADSAYLFYEHVHKGTVFDFLHKGAGDALDWPCRYSIALGVAQGLTFLHGCSQPVLLLDLSTKCILLKSLREPLIADVELFKVFDLARSSGSISTLAGSVGYIPPEYAYTMRVTAAGNVYSFGIVLLELLTGKPPVNEGIELAKWAAMKCSSRVNEWEHILDPSICDASLAVRTQMFSVMKIALSCVSQSAEARPKARNVLRMLFNAR